MLINVKEFQTIFEKVRKENASVLVFVAHDVDGLCTLRILSSLFQCEEIKYDIIPVSNYDSMKSACTEHVKGNSALKSIFVINCGAMVDLGETIFKRGVLEPHQSVYVIDSHRPFHLKNLFSRGDMRSIYFITDESIQDNQYKPLIEIFTRKNDEALKRTWEIASQLDNYHGEVDIAEESEEANNDDPMDEEDNEDVAYLYNDDDNGSDLDDFIEYDEDDNLAFDDDDYVEGGNKRREVYDDNFILGAKASDFRSKDEFNTYKVVAHYYHKTRFGSPSSHVLYQCILSTRTSLLSTPKLHNNVIWSAIVGLTEQFELERIDIETYRKLTNDYWSFVLNTNPVSRPQMQADDGYMIPISDDERITFLKDECRLMLYRHWNLYEAMQHSKYVVSQLGTYKQQGMERLHILLATIGVNLKECQQNFVNMIGDNKRHFFLRLKQECKNFQLGGIFYPSFVRYYGSTFHVSASDMVHSLIALMESPLTGHGEIDRSKFTAQSNSMSSTLWENNFTMAYEALNGNSTLIRRGISRAIYMQRAMVKQIVAKMDTPIEQSRTSMFRHIQLKSMDLSSFGSESDAVALDYGYKDKTEASLDCNLFLSPLSITRLGLFFMEILESLDNRKLPVVISVPLPVSSANSKGQACKIDLLIGISDSSSGHKFGSTFKKTYKHLKLTTVKQVGFGSSAIEISSDMKMDFISVLFLMMGGSQKKK